MGVAKHTRRKVHGDKWRSIRYYNIVVPALPFVQATYSCSIFTQARGVGHSPEISSNLNVKFEI